MKCPYCNKDNFIPDISYIHAENYGSSYSRFRCKFCDKVVSAYFGIKVYVAYIHKTELQSDW